MLRNFFSTCVVGFAAIFTAISIGLDKDKLARGFPRSETSQFSDAEVDGDSYVRRTMRIPAGGSLHLEGWLYEPKQPVDSLKESIVLLGHGLGAQKDFGLDLYAAMYAHQGMASMSFDYRTFGGSDGEPRNTIRPSMQVEDWKTVFNFAKSNGYSKIILHGTSYGGGHVVTAASQLSEDGALLGVIAQVPYLGGPGGRKANIQRRGASGILHMLLLWLLDSSNALIGQPPIGLKIASSEPNDLALMNLTPKALDQYFGKHPNNRLGGWQNFAAGRGLMDMLLYKPISSIPNLRVPTLMVSVTDDELCPVSDMEMARDLSTNGAVELFVVPGGHFDIYHGEAKERAMEKYKAFVHALHLHAPSEAINKHD